MTLLALVTLAKTNPNAVEMLHERLRQAEQAGDRRAIQMIKLAIVAAERAIQG